MPYDQLFRRSNLIGLLMLAAFSAAIGQAPEQAAGSNGVEATLYVIQGSTDIKDGSDLPPEIARDRKRLPHIFNGQKLRLANSTFARMGIGGSLDQKSLVLLSGPRINGEVPSNLAWQMRGVQERPGLDGRTSLSVLSFNFTARIPYNLDGPEGAPQRTGFQAVAFSLDQLSLPESSPTLIGTVSLPEASGSLYLYVVAKRIP